MREVEGGLVLGEFGPGLIELFIEFRGDNFGQRLAIGDLTANVHKPVLQITAGAGVNGGLDEGLHIGRQGRAEVRQRGRRGYDGDGDHVLRLGFPDQLPALKPARDKADGQSDEDEAADQHQNAAQMGRRHGRDRSCRSEWGGGSGVHGVAEG